MSLPLVFLLSSYRMCWCWGEAVVVRPCCLRLCGGCHAHMLCSPAVGGAALLLLLTLRWVLLLLMLDHTGPLVCMVWVV